MQQKISIQYELTFSEVILVLYAVRTHHHHRSPKLSRAHIWPELVESVLKRICCRCFNHTLWQRVSTVTVYRLGHWRTFSRWFWHNLEQKLSLNVPSGCMLLEPSGIITGCWLIPSLTVSCMFQLDLLEVFAVAVKKFPEPSMFPHMSPLL